MPILGSIIKAAIELRGKPPKELSPGQGIELQKKVLKKLLRRAQLTSFGEYFNFHEIIKSKDVVKAYKQNVSVYNYNKIFKSWWYRSLSGETYVTWPGKIKYFALSSGTSEASSKHIPVTHEMLKAIKKISARQVFSLAQYDFPKEFYNKGILMLGGSTHLQFNGTYYEGDLSGISAS
ncbi:MAG: GH3 auxin-responsive promoter, partial [Bacteroidetes bacterium]|nr:GH3 auxin-responsive promoter [Bacteroidota bacterium]